MKAIPPRPENLEPVRAPRSSAPAVKGSVCVCTIMFEIIRRWEFSSARAIRKVVAYFFSA